MVASNATDKIKENQMHVGLANANIRLVLVSFRIQLISTKSGEPALSAGTTEIRVENCMARGEHSSECSRNHLLLLADIMHPHIRSAA